MIEMDLHLAYCVWTHTISSGCADVRVMTVLLYFLLSSPVLPLRSEMVGGSSGKSRGLSGMYKTTSGRPLGSSGSAFHPAVGRKPRLVGTNQTRRGLEEQHRKRVHTLAGMYYIFFKI